MANTIEDDAPMDWDSVVETDAEPETTANHGGWFAAGKADLKRIISSRPDNAGRNWIVWCVLLAEANRMHSLTIRLTRGQIRLAAGYSKRSANYAMTDLKAMKLLTYRSTRDRATGHNETATITLRPSVNPMGKALHACNPLPMESPRATDEGTSVAPLITTLPLRGGESCIRKGNRARAASAGAGPLAHSLEKKNTPLAWKPGELL